MPRKPSILVVEDSPTQSMYLKLLLEEQGYRVHVARDGRQGLHAACEKRPQLIISDVVMPQMTGYEMCRAVKNDPELAQIPLILLTTLSDPEDILKGIEAKADYYLTKPFDETALLSRVKDILTHAPAVKTGEKWEELEIVIGGKRRKVRSNSTRIMNLLLSTYENAVQRNTELLKAQEELRDLNEKLEEREAQMRTIFDYASAGILVIDPETHQIVDANPTAVKMIGLDQDKVLGSICHRFICPAEAGRCPITDLHEEVNNSERILMTARGKDLPILKNVTFILFKGRRHLLESFVDISQLKKTESELKCARDDLERRVEERTKALKESQAQLIQAEKLGALGTLTAGIAHELNNPMMGMLNFAQYSKRHVDKETKVYSVLCDMERETKRCIDIVKNLQTFSRMNTEAENVTERIACVDIIERVRKLLSYRFEKSGVSFNVTTSPDCPSVSVDAGNIQQVFLNLIGNAVDAVKDTPNRNIDIQIDGDPGGHVRVRVADTGCGIPKDIFEKIFDPFYTTKGVGKGTGLGLSVSRGIIEKAGGSIEFYSETGKGTVFTVRLPV